MSDVRLLRTTDGSHVVYLDQNDTWAVSRKNDAGRLDIVHAEDNHGQSIEQVIRRFEYNVKKRYAWINNKGEQWVFLGPFGEQMPEEEDDGGNPVGYEPGQATA